MNVLEAMDDPALFRPWFKRRETWRAWRVLLAALFALPMSEEDLALFRECTGRDAAPDAAIDEMWMVIGRRGGKSLILAMLGVFLAAFMDWSAYLVPGETAVVSILAADRRQARVIFRYIRAMFTHIAVLKGEVVRDDDESIELASGIIIEISTASYRTIRGTTCIAVLGDEIAFWRTGDSANPDHEILAAVRPAMATVPGSKLFAGSSPYAKRGELWDNYRRFYGRAGPVLVWQAPTQTMNPTVPERVIAEAYERDDVAAAAEYGAQFRSDLESYVAREVVEAAVVVDRHELPPVSGTTYVAFVDPSGGSADSMTLAIAHADDKGRGIVDAIRERRPPFSPDEVVAEFAALLRSYGVASVRGDRYAGEWPRERFRAHGIEYEVAEQPKSDMYRDLLPLLNSGQVELLDLPRLVSQLCALERRTARGGKDSIDHPPGAHDDVSNCVAGVLVAVSASAVSFTPWRRSMTEVAPMPANAGLIFAVLRPGEKGECALVYAARRSLDRANDKTLVLLDVEVAPFVLTSIVPRVVERLRSFASACGVRDL
ncbi:MAG TPA: hypothetical protein VGU20_06755, partial [Stellaceae bacterium]|nr:hypothetical protein [Stellaceae bacterium]